MIPVLQAEYVWLEKKKIMSVGKKSVFTFFMQQK